MKKNNKKKSIKDFILSEDAKISKKALLIWGLGLSIGLMDGISEAWHSSSACWWSHSSSIDSSHHHSAISHSSHSSY